MNKFETLSEALKRGATVSVGVKGKFTELSKFTAACSPSFVEYAQVRIMEPGVRYTLKSNIMTGR